MRQQAVTSRVSKAFVKQGAGSFSLESERPDKDRSANTEYLCKYMFMKINAVYVHATSFVAS